MYVVQASKYTKMFIRDKDGKRMSDKILMDPKRVFREEPFTVTVPRSGDGAIILEHNKPKLAYQLVPKNRSEKDVLDLVDWLTGHGNDGSRNHESNIWGIVPIKVDSDIDNMMSHSVDLQFYLMSNPTREEFVNYCERVLRIDGSKLQGDDLQSLFQQANYITVKTMQSRLVMEIEKAREIADRKIKLSLSLTHKNLMDQYESMRSQGMKEYTPSAAESIGSLIIQDEVKRRSETDSLKRQLLDWNSEAYVNILRERDEEAYNRDVVAGTFAPSVKPDSPNPAL